MELIDFNEIIKDRLKILNEEWETENAWRALNDIWDVWSDRNLQVGLDRILVLKNGKCLTELYHEDPEDVMHIHIPTYTLHDDFKTALHYFADNSREV